MNRSSRWLPALLAILVLAYWFSINRKNVTETTKKTQPETRQEEVTSSDSRPQNTAAQAPPSSRVQPPAKPVPSEDRYRPSEETRDLFLSTRARVMGLIPSKRKLQDLNDHEIHHSPGQILKAANELAGLIEIVENNPSLTLDGLDFYRVCATENDFPSSIRASCFANFRRLKASRSIDQPPPEVPLSIRQLADKIL